MIRRCALTVLALALSSSVGLAADPKPKAYVLVGLTNPQVLGEKEWSEDTAKDAKKQLEDAGYDVTIKLTASRQDFIDAANDADARALVFVDHGVEGKAKIAFKKAGGGIEYAEPGDLTGNNYDRFKIVTMHACDQDQQGWKDKFNKADYFSWKDRQTPARIREWQRKNKYPAYTPDPPSGSSSSLQMNRELATDTFVTLTSGGEDLLLATDPIGDWAMAPALASSFGSRSFNYFILNDDLSSPDLIFSASVAGGVITGTDLDNINSAADFDVSLTYATWLAAVQNPDILLSPGIIGNGVYIVDHTGGSLDPEVAWEGFRRTVFFVPAPGLDHFQCYEVDHAVFSRAGLSLNDRFGASTVDVVKPKRLCNPANKQNEDPSAPSHPDHLAGYIIKQTQPHFTPITGVQVTNQFGTITLALTRPDTLLVPTAKSLTAPPLPFADPGVDHLKCYRTSGGKARIPNISVVDQFGTLLVDIKKPFRLCTAADKEGEGILDPNANLVCYKIRLAPGQPPFRGPTAPVFVNNQFQEDAFDVNHLRELCVPSVLTLPPPIPTTTPTAASTRTPTPAPTLTLTLTLTPSPTATVTPHVDLVIHKPKVIDPNEPAIPEADKATKGAQTWVNLDNDDQDGKFDTGTDDTDVPGENEMTKLDLILEPKTLAGTVTLAATAGGDTILIWDAANKGTKRDLPLTLNVPGDFTVDGEQLVRQQWVEGIKPHTSQRQTTLRMTFTDGNVTQTDDVALTVLGIQKIEWVGRENAADDSNTLTDNPNKEASVPDLQVFPDARVGSDGKVTAARDTVDVKVTLTVKPVEPVNAYFRSFDVDDVTSSTNPVDDPTGNEAEDEDNRGTSPAKAGKIDGEDAQHVKTQSFDDTVKTFQFQTTMQPGDNFRLVGNGDKAYLADLENKDGDLGFVAAEKERVTNHFVAGDPKDKEVRVPDSYESPVLTVWRRVYLEVDSMGDVTGNFREGEITALSTGVSSTATQVTVSNTLRDGSADLESGTPGNGRFEKGTLRVAGTHDVTNVDGNGEFFVRRAAGLDVCATALPFAATGAAASGSPTMSGTVTAISGGGLTLALTVTAHSEDPIDGSHFVGGTITIGGGTAMTITVASADATSVTVNQLRIPYRITDDDIPNGTDVPMPDRSKIAEAFAPAFVVPVELPISELGTSDDDTAFVANIASDAAADVRKGWKFDAAAAASSSFWVVYLRGAFQHDEVRDADPDAERVLFGIVDEITGDPAGTVGMGANIYMEVLRAAEFTPDPTKAKTPAYTVAHEVGHLFGGIHDDGGLMAQTGDRTIGSFRAVTLNRIRSVAQP